MKAAMARRPVPAGFFNLFQHARKKRDAHAKNSRKVGRHGANYTV